LGRIFSAHDVADLDYLQRSTLVVIVASLVFALIVFAMDKGLSTILDFTYSIFA
jgi:hypothetical protein